MIAWTVSREEHEREVAAHRKARVARLTSDRGWLTIVGKVWLAKGQHTVGTESSCDIVLPAGRAPARLGTLSVGEEGVRLDVERNAEVFARGAPVRTLLLRSDAEESPDDVTVGSLTLQLLRRADAFVLRIRDADSSARSSFPGIPDYPVDFGWRIVARLARFTAPKRIAIEDGDGKLQSYVCPGVAHFEKDGQRASLLPFFEPGEDRLFVIFSDLTNRDETYGAGRFLYAPPPEDDRVLLDFNKAFNPPCAFTPYAVCPLPPAENKLALRIEAGEKRPHPD